MSSTYKKGTGASKLLTVFLESLIDLLVIVSIILKLTGKVSWSWWAILSPIWVPVAIIAVVSAAFGIIAIVAAIAEALDSRNKKG